MKNKKLSIILSLSILIMIVCSIFYFKNKTKKPEIPQITENQYLIRTVKSMMETKNAKYKQLNENNKSFKEVIHEGSQGIFIGPYRVELAVIKYDEKQVMYGLFMDNLLGQPVYPNKTELFLKINKSTSTLPLIAVRNGLLVAGGLKISLPQTVQLFGKLNGKNVNTFLTLNNFRTKKINLKELED